MFVTMKSCTAINLQKPNASNLPCGRHFFIVRGAFQRFFCAIASTLAVLILLGLCTNADVSAAESLLRQASGFFQTKEVAEVKVGAKVISRVEKNVRLYALKSHPDGFVWVLVPGTNDQYGWVSQKFLEELFLGEGLTDSECNAIYFQAESHIRDYREYWKAGKYDASEESYNEYVRIKEAYWGQSHPYMVAIYREHALNLTNLRRYDKAAEFLERSDAISKQCFGIGDVRYLPEALMQAMFATLRGDGDKANAFNQIVKRFASSSDGDSSDYKLDFHVNVGTQSITEGKFEDARTHFLAALDHATKSVGSTHYRTMETRLRLLEVELLIDSHETIVDDIERLLTDSQNFYGNNTALARQSLRLLAIALLAKGEYSNARSYFDQSIEMSMAVLRKGMSDAPLSQLLSTLDSAIKSDLAFGYFANAERRLDKMIELVGADFNIKASEQSQVYALLAQASFQLRNYERAAKFARQAIQHSKNSDAAVDPGIYSLLANSLTVTGRTVEAIAIYRSILDEQPNSSPEIEYYLANLLMKQGEVSEAEIYFKRSLLKCLALQGNGPLTESFDYHRQLGEIYRVLQDYTNATKSLARALSIGKRLYGEESLQAISAHMSLALLADDEGNADAMLNELDLLRKASNAYARRVVPFLTEQEQVMFLNGTENTTLAWCTGMALSSKNSRVARYCAEWSLNSKGIAHELSREARRSIGSRDPGDDMLSAIRRELATLSYLGDDSNIRAAIESLKLEERRLVYALSDADSGDTVRADQWMTIDQVTDSLGTSSAFVDIVRFDAGEIFEDDLRYLAIIYHSDWPSPRLCDLGSVKEIDASCIKVAKTFRNATQVLAVAPTAFLDTSNEDLGQLAKIFSPIFDFEGGDIDHVYICADSELWTVPWSAMRTSDNKYLIEEFSISLVNSGRDLRIRSGAPSSSEAVIFADPDFDDSSLSLPQGELLNPPGSDDVSKKVFVSFPVQPLPGTRREAEAITNSLNRYVNGGVRKFYGKDVNEVNLRLLASPQVVVCSTHGFYHPDFESAELKALEQAREVDSIYAALAPNSSSLLRCGLLLAGVNRSIREKSVKLDDSILTGLEISSFDLKDTELVVLSACNSGLGDRRIGEGLASLSQAFQIAGAQSVISTLWPISDELSVDVMSGFFEHLASKNSMAKALQLSQLDQLRRDETLVAHPWTWGAFVHTTQYLQTTP
jgi:CHAT domain-containing protein/tetratricopeptide (TPR) repeat protein